MSNSSKHTPGPWKALLGSERVLIESNDWDICSVGLSPDDDERDIDTANARLIAAAPEMLEALQMVLDTPPDTLTLSAVTFQACRDAYDKVTG